MEYQSSQGTELKIELILKGEKCKTNS